VLSAVAMRAGRNWARILLVVVAALAVGWAVLVVAPAGPLVVAVAAAAVVAVVLSYLPRSKPWFV
jgi:hypothetical protein